MSPAVNKLGKLFPSVLVGFFAKMMSLFEKLLLFRSTLLGYNRLSDREEANPIKSAFLEPMNSFVNLESIPLFLEES